MKKMVFLAIMSLTLLVVRDKYEKIEISKDQQMVNFLRTILGKKRIFTIKRIAVLDIGYFCKGCEIAFIKAMQPKQSNQEIYYVVSSLVKDKYFREKTENIFVYYKKNYSQIIFSETRIISINKGKIIHVLRPKAMEMGKQKCIMKNY